jgi:putative transposase
MVKFDPFGHFRSDPETIHLAVTLLVQVRLSLWNVEYLLNKRGIDFSDGSVQLWWQRFCPLFAAVIHNKRVEQVLNLP